MYCSFVNTGHADMMCCNVFIIIIITIIIIILVVTFMQGIYNFIPETNHVYRVYSVEAVLYLQFVQNVMLFRLRNTFCTSTLTLSVACVRCQNTRF